MKRPARTTIGVAVTIALSAGIGRLHSQQNPSREEVARLTFENGRGHMRRGNYEEGLKDFRTVAETYPDSALADNARLEVSRYLLDIAHDAGAAVREADEILKRYPVSDSAPYAYLVQGEVLLQRSRRKDDLEKAVATFDRVPGIYRDAEAVPRALYLSAEAVRLSQQPARALAKYRAIEATYPSDPVIAKVHVGAGAALAATGDVAAAMEEFQFARAEDVPKEDADAALARLSTLYRLYVRPATVSPFVSTAKDVLAPRVKDVVSMVITPAGSGYFVSRQAVTPFESGKGEPAPGAVKPRAVTLDELGRIIVIDAGTVKRRNGPSTPLAVPGASKALEETSAAVALKNGDWLVASDDEGGEKGIQRFGPMPTLKHVGPFAPQRAARLAVNEFDEVAVLDRDQKTVKIFDDAGKQITAIAPKGTGYELRNPVDIAFDALGNLYVLDRTALLVFSARRPLTLLKTFTEPETSPSALRRATAFALDPFGRLYIADDHAEKIRIYQ